MKTNLYVTCATDREQLELLELLHRRGYRFPDGKALPVENLPRRGGTADRLPWALDTKTGGRRIPAPVRWGISAACGA